MKKNLFFLLMILIISLLFIAIYTQEKEVSTSYAGVAITFDDTFIDQWYSIRPILQKHNAHVTFFVSDFKSLDQEKIDKLKTLQEEGNEIAFHGYDHVNAAEFIQNHSIDEYLDNQIINGLGLMNSEGFDPVDFAFPLGADDPAITRALKKYFVHVRTTSNSWNDSRIFYKYGSHKYFFAGIGIDDVTQNNSLIDIDNGILRAKNEGKILILFAHEPVASTPQIGQISYDRLEKILQFVSDNNLKTFTVSELK